MRIDERQPLIYFYMSVITTLSLTSSANVYDYQSPRYYLCRSCYGGRYVILTYIAIYVGQFYVSCASSGAYLSLALRITDVRCSTSEMLAESVNRLWQRSSSLLVRNLSTGVLPSSSARIKRAKLNKVKDVEAESGGDAKEKGVRGLHGVC